MEKELIMVLATGVMGLFTYLLRSYFASIKSDLKVTEEKVAKLEGKLDILREDIKSGQIATTVAQGELKAIWRYIDKPGRSTDGDLR